MERESEFDAFVVRFDRRLWQALVPIVGVDQARDAATDALVYAWRHWDRVSVMDNPEGYVYAAACSYARQRRVKPQGLIPQSASMEIPRMDPGLLPALAALTDMQRSVVYLVEGCGWGLTETATLLDVSLSTVRNHLSRALAKLRDALEATDV